MQLKYKYAENTISKSIKKENSFGYEHMMSFLLLCFCVYDYQKFYQKKQNNVLGYVTIIGLTGNAFIKSFSSRSLTVKKQEEGL